ncbi:uncharacterized protein [Clytia hemisphaerica]|uniref:uncharacterized protein n=1 Tax=Clytia hemisphaerica TaxID=252671 RepID=UPI0034D507F5
MDIIEAAPEPTPTPTANNDKVKLCGKKRNCSKPSGHASRCDSNRKITSLSFTTRNLQAAYRNVKEKIISLTSTAGQKEAKLKNLDVEICKKEQEILNKSQQKEELEENVNALGKESDKLRTLFEQTEQGRKRIEGVPTTNKMINDNFSSTRYRRRKKTKAMLEYYHGGAEGANYGAWDFLQSNASSNMMEKLFLNHKRGKFLQTLYGKFKVNDKGALDRAIALKYSTFQSRRKYTFQCKIQKSMYDPSSETFGKISMTYGEYNLDLNTKSISHQSVDKFVKGLNIGELHQIEGYSGVTRTLTALTTMIVDLNLKVNSRRENLKWFKDNVNHFIVEFSDDGAPESSERTMTIGTLSLWNFGNRIRSRDYHYLLHMLSASEKDRVCEYLWQQHCEEMKLIEGNILMINDTQCTFEFVPSADTSWICFAANVLGCSATYPSPFANVHKGSLTEMGGSIGTKKEDRWQIPTTKSRDAELTTLNEFRLKNNHPNPEVAHQKELDFMAENGLRQIGPPRIGDFADRIAPEPMHLEINCWKHVLDVIYKEAVRRDKFEDFIDALKSPQKIVNGTEQKTGCGLAYIAKEIVKHHDAEENKLKRLEVRLIGSQAISLAQYSFRLVDSLCSPDETPTQQIKRLALAKICETLRDIGSLINRIDVGFNNYPEVIRDLCTIFFNMFSLFFEQHCQLTVWTMGYVIPYHVQNVFEKYGVGYGIMSMQGKEAKHAALKQELRNNTNRSIAQDATGKWHQIARSNYIRKFYLPYHFPVSSNSYHSHFRPRKAFPTDGEIECACSRTIDEDLTSCKVCIESIELMECAKLAKLTESVTKKLKPIECVTCGLRFADKLTLKNHVGTNHILKDVLNPKKMNVEELKKCTEVSQYEYNW